MLLSSTLIIMSKVGNQLPSPSPTSVVNLRKVKMSWRLPSITALVISTGDLFLSSIAHLLVYISSPSTHLHPLLMACRNMRPSSIYLQYPSMVMLFVTMASFQHLSQAHITNLAMAQVPLKPMGPPFLCLCTFPPNVYRCVLNITSVVIFITSATIIFFSSGVSVT